VTIIPLYANTPRPDLMWSSFTTVPDGNDADLRTVYCAFAVCSMLDDWLGMDIDRALKFIRSCRVRRLFSPSPPALTNSSI
jgi:geranylgeranyl transferase type-1 subunit beta